MAGAKCHVTKVSRETSLHHAANRWNIEILAEFKVERRSVSEVRTSTANNNGAKTAETTTAKRTSFTLQAQPRSFMGSRFQRYLLVKHS